MTWIFYFAISFLISFSIVRFLVWKNKNQNRFLYRLGGVGIVLGLVISVWFNPELVVTRQIVAIIIGGALILLFGVWDDLKDLSWKIQLAFQFLLALLLVFSGYVIYYVVNPLGGLLRLDGQEGSLLGKKVLWLSAIAVIFWVLLIINSLNWADGIDGLSGGVAILAAIAIFFVSLRSEVNQPAIAILSLIFIGAVLGFWVFNLPSGKIEAGSSGSYFFGFFLAAMAIMAGTKIATTLVVVMVPVIDDIWVIFERMIEGQPLTTKDPSSRHLHYRLRKAGFGDRKILLIYLGFLALAGLAASFADSRQAKAAVLIAELFVVIAFLLYIKNKTKA
jgi:UDP-GlcNAc:undecaprenyl-phosphate/decaprenyl-phosphate GlcNAc-1-phosphate transferase